MQGIISSILEIWQHQALWLVGLGVVFSLLARISPAVRGQPLWRDGFATDLCYWFLTPLVYTPLFFAFVALGLWALYGDNQALIGTVLAEGRAPLNSWPLWLQCLTVLVLSDIAQYLIHRALHTRRFWRWHAVHHMPAQLDWLSSVRFHPVNVIASVTLIGAITQLLGFAPEVFVYLSAFNSVYSAMVHANLDWHFGPLRYVLASPVFHRWHHTSPEVAGNTNLAPTFPVLDLIGGTFYMPMDQRPDDHPFGIEEPIPENRFWAQLIWPFRWKG